MSNNQSALWRYVLILEVDRIADENLHPTMIYFVEKVYPENMSKDQIFDQIQDYPIHWKEEHKNIDFFFTRLLYRIDISKPRKNSWNVNCIYLRKGTKDNKVKSAGIGQFESSTYAYEAVCHAFGMSPLRNNNDSFPSAGIIMDLFTNLESNFLHQKNTLPSIPMKKDNSTIISNESDEQIIEPSLSSFTIPSFKPYQGSEPYIFVSYCHKDTKRVIPQLNLLDQKGFKIWYDEGIHLASDWESMISHRLNDASLIVLYLTNDSVVSSSVIDEIRFAYRHKKKTLPILLDDLDIGKNYVELDLMLGGIQYIKRSKLAEFEYYNKLTESIQKIFSEFK